MHRSRINEVAIMNFFGRTFLANALLICGCSSHGGQSGPDPRDAPEVIVSDIMKSIR